MKTLKIDRIGNLGEGVAIDEGEKFLFPSHSLVKLF